MKLRWQFWDAWWPQWRSHWRVLHAWPLSAQAVLLGVLILLVSLGLSWQVSGQAWLTWWQAQEREEEAQLSLQSLQRQVKQHQERVAALQAMPHPSGADLPAWVALSASGVQANSSVTAQVLAPTGVQVNPAEGFDRQHWAGSLPSLLLAWQSLAELAPQVRVNAFVLSTDSAALAPKAASDLRLQLLSREDADQALGRSANPAKPIMHAPEVVVAAPPTSLGVRMSRGDNNSGLIKLPAQGFQGQEAPTLALSLFNASKTRMLALELSALEAEGLGRVVASPRLVTADQAKAMIEQGTELPYQVAAGNGATSIAFRKANLRLEVTPRITPEGNITMDLDVHKDSVGQSTPAGFAIDTKHVSTQVRVEDGGTVMIGGIYETSDNQNLAGVPGLRHLPGLGWLFGNRSNQRSKQELLIFLSPKMLTQRALAP